MTSAPRAFIKFFFSSLILSGMVMMHRYLFTAAIIARAAPVLPDEPSTVVPPGPRRPLFSASSTILEGHSVLDAPGGIKKLKLRPQGRLNVFCHVNQPDQGCISHRTQYVPNRVHPGPCLSTAPFEILVSKSARGSIRPVKISHTFVVCIIRRKKKLLTGAKP
jgi:hypothetical protein